tara:strand:+ start:211 stop:864 length:654 start_codon:yes stop_codon:yes gene_type:complete
MSKYKYILVAGHGGLKPNCNNLYVTAGKRSPIHEDGSVVFEGVENRRKIQALSDRMDLEGIDYEIVSHEWRDLSFSVVNNAVNKAASSRESIVLSFHSNASGNGREFTSPTGIDVFYFSRQGYSSKEGQRVATLFNKHIKRDFKDITRNRGVKGRNFSILREVKPVAILIEWGFHSNRLESKLMQTDMWINQVVDTTISAIKDLEKPVKRYKSTPKK